MQRDYEVTKHIWGAGKIIKNTYNSMAEKLGIKDHTMIAGIDCRPYLVFVDKNGQPDNMLRTLFMQE